MKLVRVPALIFGAVFLTSSIASGVNSARDASVRTEELDARLASAARQSATELTASLERLRTIDLMLAGDPVFAEAARTGATSSLNDHFGLLDELLPGALSSAGFIDAAGNERVRYSAGAAAVGSSLGNLGAQLFYRTAMVTSTGHVIRSEPYLSTITGTAEWVVTDSTQIGADGVALGVLYVSIKLDSLNTSLGAAREGEVRLRLVDPNSERVLIDTLGFRGQGGKESTDRQFSDHPQLIVSKHAVTSQGQRFSVGWLTGDQRDQRGSGWAVAASAEAVPEVSPITPLSALLFVLGITLLGLGVHSSIRLRHQIQRTAAEHLSQSLHDGLTGLPNRALFTDRGRQAISASRRTGVSCAVLLIDLDHFKEVNDTLGHAAGDQLLIALSNRMEGVIRGGDTVARLGGDEFGIVITGVANAEAAVLAARRILDSWAEPVVLQDVRLQIEGSIGVALFPEHGDTHEELLQRADVAMYSAKQGRTEIEVYDASVNRNTPRRLAMLGELRHAIENRQLVVHYQPKADLATGRIVGAEALVRWEHPTLGQLQPADFIPLAEATALIHPLTTFVIRTALAQQHLWAEQGHEFPIAVNVSPRCLLAPNFAREVRELLTETQVAASSLEIEITEGVLLADPTRALAVLTTLQQLGVQISIDDFGTGYSSLAYLKTLPVHELKIDRSFVRDLTDQKDDAVIVQAIVDLGRNLGLRVVAEGVEDQKTWEYLQSIGCDVGQGFHLSKPVDPDTLSRWLIGQELRAPLPG